MLHYSDFHRTVRVLFNDLDHRWPITLVKEIQVDALDQLRAAATKTSATTPSYTACVIKAAAQANDELRVRFPELNAVICHFLGFRWIREFGGISAGVAVSRDEDGLDRTFMLVIPEPQELSLGEITRRMQQAATAPEEQLPDYREFKALSRKPWWLRRLMLYIGANSAKLHRRHRGTFSLTTVGKFGVDIQASLPMAAPLQLGFGAVKERPVVREGQIVAARTMFLSLTFDRCLMNGRPCGEWLSRIDHILSTADDGKWMGQVGG